MNWADLCILGIILLSGSISFFYSFVRELFSLLGWLLSFAVAFIFFDDLARLLTTWFPFVDLRLSISLIVLFFSTFILLEWVIYLILNSIGQTDFSWDDQIVAIIFGLLRGFVIIILFMTWAGVTHLPTSAWWNNSYFIQTFKPIVVTLRSQMPLEVAIKFNFDPPLEELPPSF
jgi:membrane protein required for colicin V production